MVLERQESVESCRCLVSSSGSCSASVLGGAFSVGWGRGEKDGTLAWKESDKGHNSVFSWIVATIFSRVCGVRCRDLERGVSHSSWRIGLGLASIGRDPFLPMLSDEDQEFERDGTWLDRAGGESMGVTHNDSRDHTRQLRFSSRGPSFNVSEHFENMDHIAIRLQAFEGSM